MHIILQIEAGEKTIGACVWLICYSLPPTLSYWIDERMAVNADTRSDMENASVRTYLIGWECSYNKWMRWRFEMTVVRRLFVVA